MAISVALQGDGFHHIVAAFLLLGQNRARWGLYRML